MTPARRRRTTVRRSPVHGRGVYALTDLEPGEQLLEFRGAIRAWDDVLARYEEDGGPADSGLTYLVARADGTVLDCATGGNSTRFLNHSCEPNCETVDVDGRIYLYTVTRIRAGDELFIDYALVVDDPDDPETRAWYSCRCAARSCRRTMLAQ